MAFNQKTNGSEKVSPPGEAMTMGRHVVDKGMEIMQSFKPVNQIKQHVCNFALYSHDMTRQIEAHHYVSRINEDFLQCAVYDSDQPSAHLIGVEYIISPALFENLQPEEQKLWHSHAYEIKAGLWIHPKVPEFGIKSELQSMTKTYGKFWCTWQTDRGDKLPIGPPALMVSPQAVNLGMVHPVLLQKRDYQYNISSDALKKSRMEFDEPEWINPQADYWKQHGKGFAIDVQETEMKKMTPFS